jgi:uncharacterized NAD(P)/FAD-binding protein YdhS
VFLEGTPPIDAEAVLLATAYGLPAQGEGALSPYAVIDRERLARAKSIALIGSGLTMVDMFLAARPCLRLPRPGALILTGAM